MEMLPLCFFRGVAGIHQQGVENLIKLLWKTDDFGISLNSRLRVATYVDIISGDI
jgi:hypothetical protein